MTSTTPPPADGAPSRRGWVLLAAMAVLWGMPYLFIKQAVESIAPAGVVSGRTLGAAVLLLPIAIRRDAIRPALKQWRWVLAFAAIEIAGPFMLLSHAEQTLSSGLTGLLVATVPLFAALVALVRGDRSVLRAARLIGLGLGFTGVAIIVGGDVGNGASEVSLAAVGQVLLVAVCYAIAPFIVATRLRDVPALGSITIALIVAGTAYLPIAIVTQDGTPTRSSVAALIALAVVCTAVAFVVFFALIAEIGPARAPLFTYVNPIVAITLGVIVLDETLTTGLIVGAPIALLGCWLAAGRRTSGEPVDRQLGTT